MGHPSGTIRAHVFISGKVQGVGYRSAVQDRASQLGIKGWVRNLLDGRVEAVFEGDRVPIEQMISWCYQGPRMAIVTDLVVHHEQPEGLTSFTVRPTV